MTNQEVFENYGSEKWVIEHNLCFLLQMYWEELYQKKYVKESHMPVNPVGFVKKFMNEGTLCEVSFAEKSKMNTLSENTIDAEYTEVSKLKAFTE